MKNVTAGVGRGLGAYDLTSEVNTLVSRLLTSAQNLFSPGLLYPQGVLAMAGLSTGIRAGQSGVVKAMVQAASAVILAAKCELDIRSPYDVLSYIYTT